ncbi:hypothetical protein B620_gp38 [Croceibacter phage P2559S]|uniref:hypothetical protein n=1 Tax=Croceibacter phage P2559S TaxID=1176422 RepID=UPI0002688EC1|nr:hypothetical protein B620_gp38 [Croceibacter phage P2559S]AFM54816.1 hypothetical protein P2559S_38 [Croceibacter phage P2559S]
MKFYATIRIELPCEPNEKAAVEMAQLATAQLDNLDSVENPYLCYVTKQDGLNVTEVLNNID